MTRFFILLAFGLPTLLRGEDSFGELIFSDDFERQESQEVKDEPGNEWTTSSETTAGGHKQVDLRDGAMYIRTHETANHAASVRHEFAFTDGTLGLRLKLENEGDRLSLNFADLACKSVHAGHLFRVDVGLDEVSCEDLKTGVMNNEIRIAKKDGTLTSDQQKVLATKKVKVAHVISRAEWHDVLIHVKGDGITVEIDGKQVLEFHSEGIAHPTKTLLRLLPPKSAVVDEIRIWKAS